MYEAVCKPSMIYGLQTMYDLRLQNSYAILEVASVNKEDENKTRRVLA